MSKNINDKNGPNLEIQDPYSDWGGRLTDYMVPPKKMVFYYRFLRFINTSLFGLSALAIICAAILLYKLNTGPLELFIFLDGTDLTCIFDPKSGVMRQNDN